MAPRGKRATYQGYTFKSLHEFAWAQFFDAEGFEWEYEQVVFREGRESYTPDFVLDRTLPLLLIFGTPTRHYIRFKPAGSSSFAPGHFRAWSDAYQRVFA